MYVHIPHYDDIMFIFIIICRQYSFFGYPWPLASVGNRTFVKIKKIYGYFFLNWKDGEFTKNKL